MVGVLVADEKSDQQSFHELLLLGRLEDAVDLRQQTEQAEGTGQQNEESPRYHRDSARRGARLIGSAADLIPINKERQVERSVPRRTVLLSPLHTGGKVKRTKAIITNRYSTG